MRSSPSVWPDPHSFRPERFLQRPAAAAATLDGGYDFIVVHDPQPAGLLEAHGKGARRTHSG